ncbi:MAG: uptake protein [Massilia sp.]|jgi:competence protein ComEA|nr:uptake protein [Massilia sp.]
MIKKLVFAAAAMLVTMGFAFAQVDVNKADAAALDSVKGIGPKTAKLIIDERTKGGAFKDWADLETRVKGVGAKNAQKMSAAGLQVGGKSLDGADMKAASVKGASSAGAKAAPDAKASAKPADAKAVKPGAAAPAKI